MADTPPPSRRLAARRKAAQTVLRRRIRSSRAWQGTLALLLMLVAGWACLVAYGVITQPGDLWVRFERLVSGQTKEAFLLGWLTYVGWRLYFLLARSRERHRAAKVAYTLLRREHPRWFEALA